MESLCQRSFDASFKCRICTIFSPSFVSGTTIVYFWYFYSSSIHFRDYPATILNVTVGYLSFFFSLFLFYLPCSFYFVHFRLACTLLVPCLYLKLRAMAPTQWNYSNKKRQLRLIVELPFVLKYTSINLFVREEIQEYVYHFIVIRIVLAQNDAIEILYILFNIRICI